MCPKALVTSKLHVPNVQVGQQSLLGRISLACSCMYSDLAYDRSWCLALCERNLPTVSLAPVGTDICSPWPCSTTVHDGTPWAKNRVAPPRKRRS
jgi:hypothetical protein